MGGAIRVESRVGEGTTFAVVLPAAAAPADAPREAPAEAPAFTATARAQAAA